MRLNCLDDPQRIQPDDAVLVVGPGPVGLLAAQAARASGATVHVRGTERDARGLATARKLNSRRAWQEMKVATCYLPNPGTASTS